MGKLTAFNFVTLNGYFKGLNNDTNWHRHGEEESEYSVEMLQTENTLLFGRITYEMMAGYWPSQQAINNDPIVATGMNNAPKIVFSKTLRNAGWNNSSLVSDHMEDEIRRRKQIPGKNMAILGSGSIVNQLANKNLIDEYQVMVDPVIIGGGTLLFNNIGHTLNLELSSTRVFKSGVVLLCYQSK